MRVAPLLRSAGVFLASGAGMAAYAEEGPPPVLVVDAAYALEVMGPVSGAESDRGVVLDNLLVEFQADLEQALGWRGGVAYISVLSNNGGRPNDFAGTLEGVSNIEVDRQRAKIFELWVEQAMPGGAGSLAVGLLDVNRDFYVTESAGLLLSPPFGIGSEVAATGPNGPSIFPATALGMRYATGEDDWYFRGAVVGASAGTLGDPDESVADFENGALVLAEAGTVGPIGLSAGAWRYSEAQPDIREADGLGDPVHSTAQGAYIMAERTGVTVGPASADLFVRAGISDGDTTDFGGGLQAGALFSNILKARPGAQASVGLRYGGLNGKARDNLRDAGLDPADGEVGLEMTYLDPVTDWFSLQPDLQVIFNTGGVRGGDPVVVVGLRAEFTGSWRW